MQKLLLHQTADPRPIHQHRQDLPTPLADIIHTMMEKRPADRFQTPGIVAEALKPWAERATPPYPLDTLERRRQRLDAVLGRSPLSVRRSRADNNHHAHQRLARHGHKPWEIDITYMMIRLLKLFGLAKQVQDKLPQTDQAA